MQSYSTATTRHQDQGGASGRRLIGQGGGTYIVRNICNVQCILYSVYILCIAIGYCVWAQYINIHIHIHILILNNKKSCSWGFVLWDFEL